MGESYLERKMARMYHSVQKESGNASCRTLFQCTCGSEASLLLSDDCCDGAVQVQLLLK